MKISITRTLAVLSSLSVLCLGSNLAYAKPIKFTYDPANSSVIVGDTLALCGIDCEVTANVNSTAQIFELENIGESKAFQFLDFSVTGGGFINGGIANITAVLAFSTPSPASSSGGGFGAFVSASGFFGGALGGIHWTSQPGNIVFSDGTEVSLSFSNALNGCLNMFGGCNSGIGLNVAANTTLQAVPEPGVLLLFGAGLLSMSTVARRSRKTNRPG